MTEMHEDDQALLELVVKRTLDFESTLGSFYRDGLWARMDRLYHNWSQLREALRGTRGATRGAIYEDAMKEFGHDLAIPYAFSIVETVLPALLSNRPRILILPAGGASPKNVKNMKYVIDKQQSNINLELKLQSVAKDGLIYGLGVGKFYWLRREGQRTKVVPAATATRLARAMTGDFSESAKWSVETCPEKLFDDPTFEPIPLPDFGWDKFAANIDSARYAYHRTWRDASYVKSRFDDGAWNRVRPTTEELEDNGNSPELYRQSVKSRFDAQGMPIPDSSKASGNDINEVIEYHDRARIITILNRKWVVSIIQNEANYGYLPFTCWRPTEVTGQMVGKGEIEPVEDPLREMNMMRSDRRWSDTVAMNPPIFYNDGLIDPEQIKIGPGEMNPVNGDPRDIIHQIDIKGPQSSSYRETAEVRDDIVRASGVSDEFAGASGGSAQTATGTQLQLARASARIQNKTRRAELEIIKPLGEGWVRLNQRHIIEQRDVRIPAPPVPGEPERSWAQIQLGPNELAGNFDIEVDGGSTTPENVPQMRQDAQIIASTMATPIGQLFDPRQMAIEWLEKMGFKNPESKLQNGTTVPPETLDILLQHLVELGVNPAMAQQIVQGSLHEALEARDEQAAAADHGQSPGEQQGQSSQEQQAA